MPDDIYIDDIHICDACVITVQARMRDAIKPEKPKCVLVLVQLSGVRTEVPIRGWSGLLGSGTLPLSNAAINTERNFNCCKI